MIVMADATDCNVGETAERIQRYPGGSNVKMPRCPPAGSELSEPGRTIVTWDHPAAEAGPPRSAAWSPSLFDPWMSTLVGPRLALDSMETVSSRKSPTNHGGLVEVDPEPIARNRLAYWY